MSSSRSVVDQDGESVESIPWESLRGLGAPTDRRHWYVVAGAILLAGVVVSVARVASPGTPIDLAAPTAPVAPAVVEAVPVPSSTPTTTGAPVTEADLMAVDVGAAERLAVAAAETAVLAYFSQDTSVWGGVEFDRRRSTFVEYVSALSVSRLGPVRFEVVVAASVLDGADGEVFQRRPLRAVAVVVDGADGDFRPVDLPSPAAVALRPPGLPTPVEESPSPEVMDSVARLAASAGDVAGEPLSYGRLPSGETRVVAAITDPAGMTWPMSFRLVPGVVLPSG